MIHKKRSTKDGNLLEAGKQEARKQRGKDARKQRGREMGKQGGKEAGKHGCKEAKMQEASITRNGESIRDMKIQQVGT
jgi:hypothetical protein